MTGVLGFLVQCAICPQQAVVDTQPSEGGWVCPRCAEVAEPRTVAVSDLYVRCSYPYGAIAASDTCQASATNALRTENGNYLYRCEAHRGFLAGHTARYDQKDLVREVPVAPTHPFALAARDFERAATYASSYVPPQSRTDDDEYPIGKVRG